MAEKHKFPKGIDNYRYQNDYPHDLYNSRIYKTWANMKTRCFNKNIKAYCRYGGRGITLCDKWLNFAGFLDDMGDSYTEGLTLDRINNDGNYEKDNCRWVNKKVQANNRITNHLITINEITKTLAEWVEFFKQKRSTVSMRIKYGWNEIEALTFGSEVKFGCKNNTTPLR